jgi:ATP-binding cassette subfamily B protein
MDDEKESQKLNFGLLKRLLKYTFPYKKQFILGLTLILINVLLSLVWPRVTQWIIDDVLNIDGTHYGSIASLALGVGFLTLVIIVDTFIAAKRVVVITELGHNTIHDIRRDIFNHVQTLAFKYFDDRPAGKILVRITSYVDGLANLLSTSLIQVLVDFFTLVCIVIILLSTNVKLTLISFAILIPLCLFIIIMRGVIAGWSRRLRTKVSNRTAYVHENIMGVNVTQAFNHEEKNLEELHRLNKDVNYQFYRLHLSATTMGPAIDILSTTGTILVYYFAMHYIADDLLTLGALTAFTTYMSRFWQPVNSFLNIFTQFSEATGNIERIFETIDTESDIQDKEDAYELPNITGKVEYKNVTFSYDGETNILENVSFTAEPGQMIAFVGPTGAGKTTVVNLLSRFYDVNGGSVEIDGHDVRNITLDSLRTQVGVMMQDSFIFSGTIIDNIRYGRPEATDEECIAAARKVYASEFIESLPNGYYTEVHERGAGLAAGEKQLLSFARAVLADPRILILDEATSSIDTKTELLVQRALQKLLENRTSFVIAHRLSTIKSADTIMCIANKGIAEQGSHYELMEKKGIYYELNMSQYRALVNGGE